MSSPISLVICSLVAGNQAKLSDLQFIQGTKGYVTDNCFLMTLLQINKFAYVTKPSNNTCIRVTPLYLCAPSYGSYNTFLYLLLDSS